MTLELILSHIAYCLC